MQFVIMGYEKRLGRKYAEIYGAFTDRSECYRYLNKLKTGCLSDRVSFYVMEKPGPIVAQET